MKTTHTCTHTRIYMHMHTHTHTYIHTYIHTYVHIHTHRAVLRPLHRSDGSASARSDFQGGSAQCAEKVGHVSLSLFPLTPLSSLFGFFFVSVDTLHCIAALPLHIFSQTRQRRQQADTTATASAASTSAYYSTSDNCFGSRRTTAGKRY